MKTQTLCNYIHLKNIIYPQVLKFNQQGLVNLNYWETKNGTVHCFGGWDYVLTTGKPVPLSINRGVYMSKWLFDRYESNNNAQQLFGGTAESGTLQLRYAHLHKIINLELAARGLTEEAFINQQQRNILCRAKRIIKHLFSLWTGKSTTRPLTA